MLVEPLEREMPSVIDAKDFLKNVIASEVGKEVVKFIDEQVDLTKDKTIVLSLSNDRVIENSIFASNSNQIRTVIDLKPVNYQNDFNFHFRSINSTLPDAGIYIGCVETHSERKERFHTKHRHPFIVNAVWRLDFITHRVMPKLLLTQRVYAHFYRRKNKVLSKAEALGRLSYSGFEIIGLETINNLLYFSVMKTGEPKDDKNPSYGILFKMKRISKGGKIIGVYKVRTMHPYSEYLQEYVVKLNGYNKTGKPNHDFRLTSWGKIIRKIYVDEIPQLINVLKGELSLVGVRPISKFGFQSLPPDLQKERIKYKSGCIPPNVSLGMTGFDGVIEAERIYLNEMKKNRFLTNFKYFWMAIFNIICRKSSST